MGLINGSGLECRHSDIKFTALRVGHGEMLEFIVELLAVSECYIVCRLYCGFWVGRQRIVRRCGLNGRLIRLTNLLQANIGIRGVLLLFTLVNLLRDLHGLLAQSGYGTAHLSSGLNVLLDRNHTCGRCAQIYHFEVCHVISSSPVSLRYP